MLDDKTTPPFPATDRENNNGQTSHIYGVSLRGWLALILLVTVCIIQGAGRDIKEPLYSMAVMALSFYFGQNSKPQTK
jgi:hypothetical protein